MKYHVIRFLRLSLSWAVLIVMITYKTYAIMPTPVRVLGFTITLALIVWTHWFRYLLLYWYIGSFIVFQCSASYRQLYITTWDALDEEQSLVNHYRR